jgi:uncharacterized protein YbaP (TraB family)
MRTVCCRVLLGLWAALLGAHSSASVASSATPMPLACGKAAFPVAALPPRRDLPFAQGVLWRITAAGVPVSYVFGTVHSEDPRILALPPPVERAFQGARSFTMEAAPTEAAMATLGPGGVLQGKAGLQELLGPELFAYTLKLVAAHMGLGGNAEPMLAAGVERMKPWVVMSLLSLPRPRTGRFLDLALYDQARARHIPIDGLETFEEQLATLDGMSLEHQIELLKDVVCDYEALQEQLSQLIELYLQQDLAGLMVMATNYGGEHADLHRELLRRVAWERNRTMAERLVSRLRHGGVFVAIGALHLPGPEGVLFRLQQAGFTVERAY